MCFGTPVYTTTQKSELPQFLEDAYKKLAQQATAVTDPSVQYMPYGGQRLAPLTTEQQAARQLAFQGAQAFQPDLQQARGLTSLAVSPITGQDINYYMNPFQDAVTRNVLDEMRRRSDIEGQRTADAAVRAGAFGGSRFGVQEAERLRNLRDQQTRTATDLARQNYQQALAAAQSQRAQQDGFTESRYIWTRTSWITRSTATTKRYGHCISRFLETATIPIYTGCNFR